MEGSFRRADSVAGDLNVKASLLLEACRWPSVPSATSVYQRRTVFLASNFSNVQQHFSYALIRLCRAAKNPGGHYLFAALADAPAGSCWLRSPTPASPSGVVEGFRIECLSAARESVVAPLLCRDVETDLTTADSRTVPTLLQLDDRNPLRVGRRDLVHLLTCRPIRSAHFLENHVEGGAKDQMFPFERADKFNKGSGSWGSTDEGLTFLRPFPAAHITQIGNAMGYVRMIRRRRTQLLQQRYQNLCRTSRISRRFEELASKAGFEQGTVTAPPSNWTKKNKTGAAFSRRWLCHGLAYVLKLWIKSRECRIPCIGSAQFRGTTETLKAQGLSLAPEISFRREKEGGGGGGSAKKCGAGDSASRGPNHAENSGSDAAAASPNLFD
uniref:WASH-7_mid domain-containing protein n=1 Tax=Macrostomum lignano TaxID=282301 RepID=A0A1I8F6I0_9PLAT